jgi:hypothetical protein
MTDDVDALTGATIEIDVNTLREEYEGQKARYYLERNLRRACFRS